MATTQGYADYLTGNNTIAVVHRLFAAQVSATAPLASKIPVVKAPTYGLSADHRYQLRRRLWEDISTSAGTGSGAAGLVGAGGSHMAAYARLVKLGAGVDDEIEIINAALRGDTAFLQNVAQVSSVEDYVRQRLSAKTYGIVHHYLFQLYRGDIFHYDDNGSTFGYGYGGTEIVDTNSGLVCRGAIAFYHVGSTNETIATLANGGTILSLNDHMDAGGNNYGRVGAYYLKPGMLLTIYNRTGANAYTRLQDGGGNVGVVRVMSVIKPATGRFPYQVKLGSVSGAAITLTANSNLYFTLASYDYDGSVQDSWYAHTLPLSWGAEDAGYIHLVNRANYSEFNGYSLAFDPAGTLYDQLRSLVATIKAQYNLVGGGNDIAIFCDSYYIEQLRDEVASMALMTYNLADSKVVGDPFGTISTVEVDGVPVIPDPYVGPGIILIRAVPPVRSTADNPVEIQYMEPPERAIGLPANSKAYTFKNTTIPPFLAWMEEPNVGGSFFHKKEGYDEAFNYMNGWFGQVVAEPGTLGKIHGITL